jgi:hypothetical protein
MLGNKILTQHGLASISYQTQCYQTQRYVVNIARLSMYEVR